MISGEIEVINLLKFAFHDDPLHFNFKFTKYVQEIHKKFFEG